MFKSFLWWFSYFPFCCGFSFVHKSSSLTSTFLLTKHHFQYFSQRVEFYCTTLVKLIIGIYCKYTTFQRKMLFMLFPNLENNTFAKFLLRINNNSWNLMVSQEWQPITLGVRMFFLTILQSKETRKG